MLSYITIGANDLVKSGRFYSAILMPLGYTEKESSSGMTFSLPEGNPSTIYVVKPYDGREATVGNGSMTAFRVATHALVRALHAAGIEAGGTDDVRHGSDAVSADDSDRSNQRRLLAVRLETNAREVRAFVLKRDTFGGGVVTGPENNLQ